MPLFKHKSRQVNISSNSSTLHSHTRRQSTDISSPVEGHPISVAQPLVTQPAFTSDSQDPSTQLNNRNEPISKSHVGIVKPGAHEHDHTFPSDHPDTAHVAQSNTNQPTSDPVDPKRGVKAGTLPPGALPPGHIPDSQEWQKQQGEGATRVVVEEKMPFKDQVKAWAKVHRGTVSIYYRIP